MVRGPRRSTALRASAVGAVFARNFAGYLSSPAGYVFITLFVLVCSWFEFWQPIFFTNNVADLSPLNEWMPYILLFFVPAITMSIWSEERKQGTDELLLTLPVRDVEVVLGKYLAALGIFTVSLGFLALGHIPVLAYLGKPDLGVIASTFVGYWLMGGMLIALGMVASMLTNSVTVAFILGALFCAIPVFLGGMGPFGRIVGWLARVPGLGWLGRGGGTGLGEALSQSIELMSVPAQFRDFGTGVIPLVGVFYFVGMAVVLLYLNMVLVSRRHWAGGQGGSSHWLHALARVMALIVALICADALIGRWMNVRADATEERLHSLSPLSFRLAREIPDGRQVDIQAYLSAEVPREYVEVKTNLVNALKEYAGGSGNRIRLNLIETKRFSEEAREASRRFGITPRRVQTTRDGTQTSEEIFLGVAFTSGLEQVVIPFFDRGLPVEYELTRSIRVVSGAKRKRVGVLETDARMMGRMDMRARDPEWAFVSELRKQYEVVPVSADVPIPTKEVQTLTIPDQTTGGAFTLTFEGETTAALPFNADAKAVQTALEALKAVGAGQVVASGGPLPKSAVQIAFGGRFLGTDAPDLTIQNTLTGPDGAKPVGRVAVTTPTIQALVVAQAPSLKQRQMDNLERFIRAGGPTLILVDPLPQTMPFLAPSEQPLPDPNMGMMGGQTEPKGNLRGLFDALGLDWPAEQIVWNPGNPHPQFEFPPGLVFVSREATKSPLFADDTITTKLQEVFFAFPGHLRALEMPNDPKFTPLLSTDRMGGTVTYGELVDLSPMGRLRPPPRPRFIPSNAQHVLAARLEGKMRKSARPTPPGTEAIERDARVIVVADLDMISDSFFSFRRKPVEWLDAFNFDNIPFILNCVDTLTGDDTFIELRKKRPTFRTLSRLEEESKKFIAQSQAEETKALDDAKTQLDEANSRLTEAVDGILKSDEYDDRTKAGMVELRRAVEGRRLELKAAEIEAQRDRAIQNSRDRRDEAIDNLQNGVRAFALVYPPLPALLLGAIVFVMRTGRENIGANPERIA